MTMAITNVLTNSGGNSESQWFNYQSPVLMYWIDTKTDRLVLSIEDLKRNSLTYVYEANFILDNGALKLDNSLLWIRSFDGEGGLSEKYLNKPTIKINHANLDYYKDVAHLFFEIEARAKFLTYVMKADKDPKKIHNIIEPMFQSYRSIFEKFNSVKKTLFTDIWS